MVRTWSLPSVSLYLSHYFQRKRTLPLSLPRGPTDDGEDVVVALGLELEVDDGALDREVREGPRVVQLLREAADTTT